MIYLDNAATTLPDPQVVETVAETLRSYPGNPSSLHGPGRAAHRLLHSCRKTVANALGAEAKSLYFTSGGTESNNWALCGAVHAMRHRGRHIISTAIEHDAVLAPLRDLTDRGYELTLLKPEKTGQISSETLAEALRPDTVLVSMMLVNNETGAILPVSELAETVRKHTAALFHADAVSAFCKIPFTAPALGVDLLSVSAHKLHGPKGVGALWIRPSLNFPPLFWGGGQEENLRAGTEPLHNIAGFAKAVALMQESRDDIHAHLQALSGYLRENLPIAIPAVQFLPQGAPHIVSLSLPGTQSEVLMNDLDRRGIYISHAAACKRGAQSHVLTAMGLPKDVISGTIRVSFSRHNSRQDVDALIRALQDAKKKLFPSR